MSITCSEEINSGEISEQAALEIVKLNGLSLFHFPFYKDNKNVVLTAVTQNGYALEHASEELQNDTNIIMAALEQINYIQSRLQRQMNTRYKKPCTCETQTTFKYPLECISPCNLSNKQFIMTFLSLPFNPNSRIQSIINFVPLELIDISIVIAAVKQLPLSLDYLVDFQNHREVVSMAVSILGAALEFASPELKADKNLVKIALRNDGSSLRWADPELMSDKETVMVALENDGYAFRYISTELKDDEECLITAINTCEFPLMYASYRLRSDKHIVLLIVSKYGRALQFASSECQSDLEIIYKAIKNDVAALQYANEDVQNNKKFILDIISHDESIISYSSKELQEDINFIIECVLINPKVVNCINKSHFRNEKICHIAVNTNGLLLNDTLYFCETLKDNFDIMFMACSNTNKAVKYTTHNFRKRIKLMCGIYKVIKVTKLFTDKQSSDKLCIRDIYEIGLKQLITSYLDMPQTLEWHVAEYNSVPFTDGINWKKLKYITASQYFVV